MGIATVVDHHGMWLPSVKFGLPVLVIIGIFLLALAITCAAAREGGMAAGFTVVLLVLGGAAAFGYWPWHADYHKLQPINGVVQTVDTRFMTASQYIVITYQGGVVVRCDDSRCSSVRGGDELRLLCTKEHQFGSPQAADGWSCRWGEQ